MPFWSRRKGKAEQSGSTDAGQVEIRIFDVAGRLVNTIVDQAALGDNFVTWDGKARSGRDVPSAVYFYQIKAGDFTSHKKMLLIH